MNIFIIYDSRGFVWDRAYTSFKEAVDIVLFYLEQENRLAKTNGFYEHDEDRPAKMEKEFTYKDDQSGVMVAYNEFHKISTFVKKLTI